MEIESIVLSVDSRPVVAADKALDDFAKAGAGAEASAKGVSKAWSETSASLKKVSSDTGAAVAALDRLNATQSAALAEITRFVQAADRMQQMERQLVAATAQLTQAQADLARQTKATADAQTAAASAATPFTQKMTQSAAAVGAVGVSAKQTAAAMRQLPAQLSDVVVSLAGGQNPLMVLLQQGSQVKDSFGGLGATFRALGAAISPTIVILSAAAAAIGTVAYGAIGGAKESTALKTALIETGGAAGLTASQISKLAESTGQATGEYGKSREAAQLLAASGKFAGNELSVALRGVVEGAANGTKSVETLVGEFEALGKEPTKAVIKLNESTNFLTTSVFNQISALDRQGKAAEASALAQKAYADALATRRGEIVQNIGYVEGAWDAVTRAIGKARDAVLNLGRDRTTDEQLKVIKASVQNASLNVDSARSKLATNPDDRYSKQALATAESNYQQHLQRQLDLELTQQAAIMAAQSTANRQRDEQRSFSAKQELDGYDKTLTKVNQLAAQLKENARIEAEIRKVDPTDPRVSDAAIAERKAETIKKLTEKTSTAAATAAAAQERYSAQAMAAIDAQIAEQTLLNKTQEEFGANADKQVSADKEIIKLQEQLGLAVKNRQGKQTDAEIKDQLAKLQTLKVMQQTYAQTAKDIKLEEDFRAVRNKGILDRAAEVDKIREKAQATEDEVKAFGKSKEQLQDLTIARLEEQRAILAGFPGSAEMLRSIDEEIEARKRLGAAIAQKEVLEANKKAADEVKKDWDRIAEQAGQSLSDAIMNGGKSGGDLLKNYFKNLVLRPLLDPVAKAGASLVADAFGMGGTNAAPGTVGATDSLLSTFTGGGSSSIFKMFSQGGASFGDSVVSTLSNASIGSIASEGLMGDAARLIFENAETIGQVADVAGNAFAYGGAILSAINGKFGAAIGGAIGAYFGGPIGSFIGSKIGALLDGPGRKPGVGNYGIAEVGTQGINTVQDDEFFYGDRRGYKGESAGLVNATQGIASNITGLAARYGGDSTGLRVGMQTAYSPDKKGANAGTVISRDGVALFGTAIEGTNEDLEKNAALVIERSILGGLQQSNIAPQFANVLRDADITNATQEQIDALKAQLEAVRDLNNAFDAMGHTFPQLVETTWDAREAIVSASGGLEGFSTKLQSYYEGYYSEQERMDNSLAQMTDTFKAMGIKVVPQTRDEFRKLVEGLDLTTVYGQQAYATLLGMSEGFGTWSDYTIAKAKETSDKLTAQQEKDAKDLVERIQAIFDMARSNAEAAYSQAQSDASNAMSILTKSVSARKAELQKAFDSTSTTMQAAITAAESAVSNLTSVSSQIKATLRTMAGVIDPQGTREGAQARIANALTSARYGVMPKAGELDDALSLVAQPATDLFSTFEDYQLDFLKTANDIAALGELTDTGLSLEQQNLATTKKQLEVAQKNYDDEIARLDASLELAQAQLEAAEGTHLAVMSVADAIVNLDKSILALSAAKAAIPPAASAANGLPANATNAEKAVYEAYQASGIQNLDVAGMKFWVDAINNGADLASIVAQIKETNTTKNQPSAYDTVYGAYAASGLGNLDAEGLNFWMTAIANGADPTAIAQQIRELNAINGSHANGLWSVPFDGYNAMLHKGETVLPAPEAGAYRALQDRESSMDSYGVASILSQMDLRLSRMEKYSENTSEQTERFADDFDRVTNKGNAMITEPLADIA